MTDVWLGQAEFLRIEAYITNICYEKPHILRKCALRDVDRQGIERLF